MLNYLRFYKETDRNFRRGQSLPSPIHIPYFSFGRYWPYSFFIYSDWYYPLPILLLFGHYWPHSIFHYLCMIFILNRFIKCRHFDFQPKLSFYLYLIWSLMTILEKYDFGPSVIYDSFYLYPVHLPITYLLLLSCLSWSLLTRLNLCRNTTLTFRGLLPIR